MFLWSGMLFTLSFCSLFILLFVWLTLFLLLFHVLFSMCYSYCFLWECCLINYCGCELGLYASGFPSVLECDLKDLSLCVSPTDPKDITWLLSVFTSCAYSSWWSVILSLLCIWYMICCCGFGCPFLLLHHGSMVHHHCVEPLQ